LSKLHPWPAPLAALVLAAAAQAGPAPDSTPELWAIHVQATDILQAYGPFRSPYGGRQSYLPGPIQGNTFDATLYAGLRPWVGAELWGTLEMYQGYAPSNTLGSAGYVNGDGAKLGRAHVYARIPRLFLRQTFALGADTEAQESEANQLGGPKARDRVVVTVGKYNVTDIFDQNAYAHDPRKDFMNWSAIDAGSFDYAADAWGYTYGAAIELYKGDWTWRAGYFDLSILPNTAELTHDLSQFQLVGEAERRTKFWGRPGAVRLTGFLTRGRQARYDDAVAAALGTGRPANVADARRYASRPGVSLNLEQEVADGVGLFARAGADDGRYESYEFTDIDQTLEAGISIKGARWGRKDDVAAIVLVENQVSAAAHRYMNAGGLGILVGDGRLPHPGNEKILEAWYSLALPAGAALTLDDQLIDHPAYNRDRGPVNVVGLRLHVER
jgi:high affinity Mn2+ porin